MLSSPIFGSPLSLVDSRRELYVPPKNDHPVTVDAKAIARRLRETRRSRGLTQTEIAAKVGLTQTLVSDYEIGRLRLNAALVVKFAKALRVSSDELLGLKHASHDDAFRDRRFIRRLQAIDKLSRTERQALLKTIDHFLRGAQVARSV